jgi:glycosyltransferase involved in cell wall biosynthesis
MTCLAIDASNISSGGGLTHLVQLLSAAKPSESNINAIHVWASSETARKLPKLDWLIVHTPYWCDAGLAQRIWHQQFFLPGLVKKANCDALLSPGGILPMWSPVPTITISQNMLPFELDRAALFGRWSWIYAKMRILRVIQGSSFRRAQGVIFLSRYARDSVLSILGRLSAKTALIAHGIERRFVMRPRPQKGALDSAREPFYLLYVSVQIPYKHHLEVMQAVAQLRQEGLPVVLHMVGANTGVYGDAVRRLRLILDPAQSFLRDLGHVNFERLHELYRMADVFVFASSCENLPNILIEAMAAGLPIACADRGPMPEILADSGQYFDPQSSQSIARSLDILARDPALRRELAERACDRASAYSWDRCARETLDFVSDIARENKRK